MILPVLLPLLLGAGYEVESLSIRMKHLEDDVINVTKYGAKCDFNTSTGTGTDDTDALKAAIAAGTGKSVRIPANPGGTCCMVSAALVVPSGTTILGDGYNSCIVTKPGGWHVGQILPSTIDYGNIVLHTVSDVRVTNLRLRGAKDTPDTAYEYSPNLIQLTNVQRITIDHVWFENTHYSAIWTGGTQSVNKDLIFEANHVDDCGYVQQDDALGNGGGGVIQWNGDHGVFIGNTFRKVGYGISATGSDNLISGNTFTDFQGFAAFIGDSQLSKNNAIVGNVFDSSPTLTPGGGIYTPTAVYASNSIPGRSQTNSVLIKGNKIYFGITNTATMVRGVAVSGIDAVVEGNAIDFDVQVDTSALSANRYVGFQWQAADVGPTIQVEGNAVYGFSSNGAANYSAARGITAFSLVPNTAKIQVFSRHNIVRGLPETCAAIEYLFSAAPNHFSAYLTGDVSRGGSVRVGQTFIATRHTPISLAYDSEVHASTFQTAHVTRGTASMDALSVSGSMTAGNLSGTNTGDLSLGASTNGLSLASGQVLSLAAASGASAGALTTSAQTIAGNKTFTNGISVPGIYDTNTAIRVGVGATDFNRYAAPSGQLHEFRVNNAIIARISDASGSVLIRLGELGPVWTTGSGTPEGAVSAPVGSLYSRSDGGAGTTLYVKESGTGNTGWVAK